MTFTNTDPALEQIRSLLDRLDPVAVDPCDVPGCIHHMRGREWSGAGDSSSC
jgi:hypothetical protein